MILQTSLTFDLNSLRKNRISRLREFGPSGTHITTVPLFNAARTCLQQVMGARDLSGPLVYRGPRCTCPWWRNVSLRIAAYREIQSTCHKKRAREIVPADACFSLYSVFGSRDSMVKDLLNRHRVVHHLHPGETGTCIMHVSSHVIASFIGE